MRRVAEFFVKLIGLETILDVVAGIVGKLLLEAREKFKVDEIVYSFGLKIREKTPTNVVEENIAHVVKSFKYGLLGKDLIKEEIEIEDVEVKN